jgi:bifunctional DNA-binding transcriptional regulator/antitoxin component of YhaV-PrlF toxin-antitoxin module
MKEQIIEITPRGQITIPKKIRDQLKSKFITIKIIENQVILSPLQTVNNFLDELDESFQDWKEHGGKTLSQMKKAYGSKE